jgi:hypothetical protein
MFSIVLLIAACLTIHMGRQSQRLRLPPAKNRGPMISTACHPDPDEVDPHLERLQWGVIEGSNSFSLASKSVQQPVVGERYD